MARSRDMQADGGSFAVIPPLARGLDVLRAFQAGDAPLRNQELSRRTGIPPSSVSRLTGSLVAQGYLSYDANSRSYTLTPAVLALAYAFVAGNPVRSRLQPGMQELANKFGAMVGLGMQDKLHMVYVACCKGHSLVPFRSEVGSRYPLARSAIGWAYLAGLDEGAFASAMDEIREADEGAWSETKKKIERAKQQVHTQGFCVSIGEWEPGVHTVGAPVRTRADDMPYAISCGAPAYQLKEDQLMVEIGPRLTWLARSVQQDPIPAGRRRLEYDEQAHVGKEPKMADFHSVEDVQAWVDEKGRTALDDGLAAGRFTTKDAGWANEWMRREKKRQESRSRRLGIGLAIFAIVVAVLAWLMPMPPSSP